MEKEKGTVVVEQQTAATAKTPLYEKHAEAGARFVDFASWEMPLQYEGIIQEHLHTRSSASLFDTSHMGELIVRGHHAVDFLDKVLTCRVSTMEEGRCRYCTMLNHKGGIIDDLIVFRPTTDEFMLVVNAATKEKDHQWLQEQAEGDVQIADESASYAKLDLQGHLSTRLLEPLVHASSGGIALCDMRPFQCGWFKFEGTDLLVSRTGYTGELGYELFIGPDSVCRLWDALNESDDVKPAGLGARDTLRLEKGLRLYGNDIDETRTPLEANLARFVNFNKSFIGREALERQREEGVRALMTGFFSEGRRIARGGFTVKIGGEPHGVVTSGAHSPSLNCPIGLCYITPQYCRDAQDLVLTDGRRDIHARVVSPPMLK